MARIIGSRTSEKTGLTTRTRRYGGIAGLPVAKVRLCNSSAAQSSPVNQTIKDNNQETNTFGYSFFCCLQEKINLENLRKLIKS